MILTELIRDQVLGVTVMFGAGIFTAILYQLFTCICRIIKPGRIVRGTAEIIFWAAAAVPVTKFLYYCAYGQISVHVICAFAGGALLWKICFYDIINRVCSKIETIWEIDRDGEKEKKKQSV